MRVTRGIDKLTSILTSIFIVLWEQMKAAESWSDCTSCNKGRNCMLRMAKNNYLAGESRLVK